MLRITNFTKTYGHKVAVDNLSLHIRPGEICGFIGHNGEGKTTTLKACCGILQFNQGEILIGGKSIKTDPLICKQQIAYVPDNPDLYDFLTGIRYLNFVADIYGVSQADRTERIRHYGELLGMPDDLALPIGDCSHGMKQKVALIAALLHKPKLILMDEPFVGLDPIASHQLKNVMAQHCAEGGAIFFSTHVLEVAEKLCDQIVIIKGGKLVACGTMDEVRGLLALLNGLLGMWAGLQWAKLEYISEAYPCKQSVAVLVTMFGMMGVPLVLGIGYAFFATYEAPGLYLALCALLLAAACYGLYRVVMTWGVQKMGQSVTAFATGVSAPVVLFVLPRTYPMVNRGRSLLSYG